MNLCFFSSRRRHTRCSRDWSSDVCSSDLAWLWLPPQDPAAKPPPNRRPLWLPLHCAAARQEASLRFVPRQPNPQKKEQHQENFRSSLISSFSPFFSFI